MRSALVLLGALVAGAAAQWVGMTPNPAAPRSIELFHLGSKGTRERSVGTVEVTAAESVNPGAFRCMPGGGFCVFATQNAAGSDSWLYNVSAADARVFERTYFPGVLVQNVHLDASSGAAIVVAVAQNVSAAVLEVQGGKVTPVVDITNFVGNGTVPRGSSTACASSRLLWVGVKAAVRPDLLLTVDLVNRRLTRSTPLSFPLLDALWANCNTNVVGGTNLVGSNVFFGAISSSGTFSITSKAAIATHSPPYQLSGLLSQPPANDFFFTLYPAGAAPGTNASGLVVFGNFAGLPTMPVSAIDYFLTGASRVS